MNGNLCGADEELLLVKPEDDARDLGATLNYVDVARGLRELNPGITMDLASKQNQPHPFESVRAGVFYHGKHICSIDRGIIPEFTIWDSDWGQVPIRMCEIERYEDSKVVYAQVLETDERYNYALMMAQRGDDEYHLGKTGKVFNVHAFRWTRVKHRVLRGGWRHTFSRLIAAKIPGVTERSLSLKFGVSLMKYAGASRPEFRVEAL